MYLSALYRKNSKLEDQVADVEAEIDINLCKYLPEKGFLFAAHESTPSPEFKKPAHRDRLSKSIARAARCGIQDYARKGLINHLKRWDGEFFIYVYDGKLQQTSLYPIAAVLVQRK